MKEPLIRSARGYDQLARWYRVLEWLMFGRVLHRSRIALLGEIPDLHRALFLGDGDGRLLKQFCVMQPHCHIVSIDQSAAMIDLQQRQIQSVSNPVVFHQRFAGTDGFAERLSAEIGGDKFDLIVWPYFLDCFTAEELRVFIPGWLSLLNDGGLVYFVDFVRPPCGPKGWVCSVKLLWMHWLFRWQTGLPNRKLVNLPELIERSPVRLLQRRDVSAMMTTRLYQLLDRQELFD